MHPHNGTVIALLQRRHQATSEEETIAVLSEIWVVIEPSVTIYCRGKSQIKEGDSLQSIVDDVKYRVLFNATFRQIPLGEEGRWWSRIMGAVDNAIKTERRKRGGQPKYVGDDSIGETPDLKDKGATDRGYPRGAGDVLKNQALADCLAKLSDANLLVRKIRDDLSVRELALQIGRPENRLEYQLTLLTKALADCLRAKNITSSFS